MKNLPNVPTWRLEWDSNPRPFGRKASTQPMRPPTPHLWCNMWVVSACGGLDPAGIAFDTADPAARLSPDDAQFVDVIHVDTAGFSHSGTTINVGQVDFWPNKGVDQPGCSGNVCSHFRGQAYYTESLTSTSCTFISDKCDSIEDMQQARQHSSSIGCSNQL